MTAASRRTVHAPSLPAWHVATSDSVRAILANAYATDEPPRTIGDVTLMPHQRDALARIRNTIREFHGALLADEVGLGKTYVALALAHDYEHTHVVAPAALLPMWRAAIARTASHHIELHSLHAFSRASTRKAATARDDPTPHARHTLVIIDEAHHLRTRNTRRYQAVADFVAGRDLLLLSATPIHNASRELRHLLALFTGLRDDLLSPESLARLIVRQTATHKPDETDDALRTRYTSPPRVREHPPLRVPHDRETLDAILALPSPLPARDGAVAGALIRLGMLRAWCSSDAALTHVIQRRLLRGEALKQALIAGRHPTQAELRTWLVGDHEVQLGFPELLTTHAAESGPLLDVLTRHLDALDSLLTHQRRHRVGDAARAHALRDIAARHPNTPIIAFSQFTRTVQSLYRALSDIAGVGALTGLHAQIASGRIARLDAIARFAPTAQGRPPPPPHQAIRLLLSTDILAEGVNLQDASVVVHLDLPWTDALRRQRVGRVARIGSTHDAVDVYAFAPHPAGDRALTLTARLLTKSRLAAQLVGQPATHNPPLTTHHPVAVEPRYPHLKNPSPISPADVATLLHNTLNSWRTTQSPPAPTPDTQPSPRSTDLGTTRDAPHHSIPIAQLVASRTGWLAAISSTRRPQLVAHTNTTSTEPARIWQLLSSLPHPGDLAPTPPFAMPPMHPRQVSNALRQLHHFLADLDIASAVGPTPSNASHAQTLARQRLAQVIANTPPHARQSLFTAMRDAEQVIDSAFGIGAESALESWSRLPLTTRHDTASSVTSLIGSHTTDLTSLITPSNWLSAWRAYPPLRQAHAASASSSTPRTVPATPDSLRPPSLNIGSERELLSELKTHSALHSLERPRVLALLLFRTPPS